VLVNAGTQPHGLALGGHAPFGFTQLLRPRQKKVVFVFLGQRGRLAYRATLPADRAKPGMRGVFTVV
jgi:hypothetical protein